MRRWTLLAFLLLPSCRLVLNIDEATELPDTGDGMGGEGTGGNDNASTGGGTALPNDEDPSGDGDGDGDGDEGMGGDTSKPEPKDPCEIYCDDMDQYCKDDDMQYVGKDQCLATCALYDEGVVGQNGNTQSCRVKYASKGRYTAGIERSLSCRQAGPAGYDMCGSMCEGYCTVMMAACTPEVTSLYFYETFSECMDACASIPTPSDVPYSVANGDVFDGGHLQCRLFHAESALMLDAEEHCEHALGVTLCEITE